MLQTQNPLPFASQLAVMPDQDGVDALLITVKGSFALSNEGRLGRLASGEAATHRLELAEEQVPIALQDSFHGEPGNSSLKQAAELHLPKPGTDVLLLGAAHGPGGREVRQIDVSLRVGTLHKTVRVYGDRHWSAGLNAPTDPEPFSRIPLVWERAYGGVHEIDPEKGKVLAEERNPVGRGFPGKRRGRELAGLPLPNLEDPRQPLRSPRDRPAPAAFAFVAPSWLPRRQYAGTYDQAWQQQRAPYLPADFDSRFFHCAPTGLRSSQPLTDGAPVTASHASPGGTLRFSLPHCRPVASVRVGRRREAPAMRLETVQIEPDAERVMLLWRGLLHCDKQALEIEEVKLGLAMSEAVT